MPPALAKRSKEIKRDRESCEKSSMVLKINMRCREKLFGKHRPIFYLLFLFRFGSRSSMPKKTQILTTHNQLSIAGCLAPCTLDFLAFAVLGEAILDPR